MSIKIFLKFKQLKKINNKYEIFGWNIDITNTICCFCYFDANNYMNFIPNFMWILVTNFFQLKINK